MMKRLGRRSAFAIEVEDSADSSGHFSLDFYLRDIQLNRADNQGYLKAVANCFPNSAEERRHLRAMADSLGCPAWNSVEGILAAVLADPDLFLRCSRLNLGPVTDSFSLLALPDQSGVIVIGLRNDRFQEGGEDMTGWSGMVTPDGEQHRFLSVALSSDEYLDLIDAARGAILDVRVAGP